MAWRAVPSLETLKDHRGDFVIYVGATDCDSLDDLSTTCVLVLGKCIVRTLRIYKPMT